MTGTTGEGTPRTEHPGPGPRRLLVGIGAPERGDDAVGPAVVALVSEWALGSQLGVSATDGRPMALPAGTRVLTHTDPSRLVEEMAQADLVVIVDAVRTGGPAGTVHILSTGADLEPLPGTAGAPAAGSHGFGVDHALALARALGTLPPRVVLVGVEGARFDLGAVMSKPVRDALVPAASAVLHALGHDEPHVAELPAGLPHPTAMVPPPTPRAPG